MTHPSVLNKISKQHSTFDSQIASNGWISLSMDLDDLFPIAHTMGLIESYDHPEFFTFGFDPEMCGHIFSAFSGAVQSRGSIPAGLLIDLGLELIPMHPSWLESNALAAWASYYERPPVAGEVLQIKPGPTWQFGNLADWIPRLDQPYSDYDPKALLEATPTGPTRRDRRMLKRLGRS
jgi:hypothetical protein